MKPELVFGQPCRKLLRVLLLLSRFIVLLRPYYLPSKRLSIIIMAAPANQVVLGFVANALDNEAQRSFAFPGLTINTTLVTRNLDVALFDHTDQANRLLLALYAHGRCSIENWNIATYARPLVALEAIGPNIPADKFLDGPTSRTMFNSGVLKYLIDNGVDNAYTAGFNAAYAPPANLGQGVAEAYNAAVANPNGVFAGSVADTLNRLFPNMQPQLAWNRVTELCVVLARSLFLNRQNRAINLPTNLYVLCYVALAKRGQVTAQKLAKIATDIEQSTNRRVDVTDIEVGTMFRILERFVDETNAGAIMAGLSGGIGAHSLRLRLTLDQSARGGMTTYWCIMTAFQQYNNFNWGEASRFIPTDFANYRLAFDAVGRNEFYGFKKNLGNAAHTKYKTLGWLAIQMLMKYNPAEYGTLQQYRGMTNNPDRRAELQNLIDNFNPAVAPVAWAGLPDLIRVINE
ncbi:putative nucleocapsid [Trialeurodes vaporariorum mononega-like virus 2]|uniref:Nucleocapsid n=3 Tax=Chuviridae TaxID=2501952 RepID=A0A916PCX1_9VIRU|nr:putative nucleocapsid [Trialeurodes vaporariorum mononega-like virus 2]QLL27734.1 putative nucleocapsid [Leveillula taurica associated chu-like virus 1]QMP82124.1 nucleocapsid protein [Hemipteran chu-related virus OKIAV138]DAZ90599.1 TPA_asm: putative nucleocapsid [Trialeurodes vaporariorum mononega-like virus 2]